jgi:hypothetical protein
MAEERSPYRLLVGKPEVNRPLGRPKHRWVDLVETGWGGVSWIDLAQAKDHWRAFVDTEMNLLVP